MQFDIIVEVEMVFRAHYYARKLCLNSVEYQELGKVAFKRFPSTHPSTASFLDCTRLE